MMTQTAEDTPMKVLVEPVTLIRERENALRRKHPKKRRKSVEDELLLTLIMGSHVRGLECWHALIRTNHLSMEIDCVVHVDSHPDMMLPKGDFSVIEADPRLLYESLEASQGGIAEWLLPAFFLGHCSRLVWLRAVWCDQLQDGESEFFIGIHKKDGSIRVTSREPYFMDEPNTHASLDELERVRKVTLLVVSVTDPRCGELVKSFIGKDESSSKWLLDICLDYFAVSNPFFDHAVQQFGETAALTLRDAFLQVRWRARYEAARCQSGGPRGEIEESEKSIFEAIIRRLVDSGGNGTFGVDSEMAESLNALYDHPEPCDRFLALIPLIRAKGEVGKLVTLELMESPGLPHHPSLDLNQQELFAQLLQGPLGDNPPSACVIARSDEDEYTPDSVCSNLETWTIEAMQRAWNSVKVEALSVEVFEEDDEQKQ